MARNIDNEVNEILEKMTLEQKVGGCLVVDFMGTVINQHVKRMITDFHVAGLRVDTSLRGKASYAKEAKDEATQKMLMSSNRQPTGYCRDFTLNVKAPACSPSEYAKTLNTLREIALKRPLGIPIHTTLDQEGNGNENFTLGNVKLFPSAMGLASTKDPELVYKAACALAKQLKAAGINWIHSPVLDVNTNHKNPELNTRSYSDDTGTVEEYALATLRGFAENKLIATGKHFPGRGDSDMDSHKCLPEIRLTKESLLKNHVRPYKKLIENGLPSVMVAHTAYPLIDESGEPATVSKKIITGILREELGFDGVVTTDNMLMGGIVSRYGVAEACVRAIQAGQDLLLLRSETSLCEEVFNYMLKAAKEGRLPVERLNEANRRVLKLKFEYGLFENGGIVDPEEADRLQKDNTLISIEKQVAEKASILRNEQNVIPLKADTKVLLVEQVHATHKTFNNIYCYPSVFWSKLGEVSENVYSVEITDAGEKDFERVKLRIPEADVIIATNYVARRSDSDISDFIRELMKFGKPVVVVTNSPFEFGSPEDFKTLVNVFSGNPESLRVAAEIIYGKRKALGSAPIKG